MVVSCGRTLVERDDDGGPPREEMARVLDLRVRIAKKNVKTIFATHEPYVIRIRRVPLDTIGIGFVGGKNHLGLQKYQKVPQIRDIAKTTTMYDLRPGRGGAV